MDSEGRAVTELGYDLASVYWNRGLATEAAIAVRDYAFADLRLPELASLIRVGNVASRRVAEKVGMSFRQETMLNDIDYRVLGVVAPGASA